MNVRIAGYCASLPWLLLGAAMLPAAGAAPAEAADANLQIQGEYQGPEPFPGMKHPPGIQVIARGQGKFHAVGHPTGLPGIAEGPRPEGHEVDGELKDGVVTFAIGERIIATIENREFQFKVFDAPPFKRVERQSPTLGAKPPTGAVVLFDGTSAEKFAGGRLTDDGLLMQGATSTAKFQDCSVHLEFRLPFLPEARDQARGNSGVYLQGRYEVQVLDSFGLAAKDHDCGGIYSVQAPRVNMCFPPGVWQTYDIDFTAARFAGGQKTKPARLTVRHNGVLIHEDVEVPHATTAAPLGEGAEPGPLYLQDHGNEVRYRNIWVVERK